VANRKPIKAGDQVACRQYDFAAGKPLGKRWTGMVVGIDRTATTRYIVTRPGEADVILTRFEIKAVVMRAKEEPCTPVLPISQPTLSLSQEMSLSIAS
jgi:hypothetical protein